MKTIPRDGGRIRKVSVRVTNWRCGCSKLYSQQGQVDHEDPHSLSGREPPAEQNKMRTSENKHICCGSTPPVLNWTHYLQTDTACDGKPPIVPQSGGWEQTARTAIYKNCSKTSFTLQREQACRIIGVRKRRVLHNYQDITFVKLE